MAIVTMAIGVTTAIAADPADAVGRRGRARLLELHPERQAQSHEVRERARRHCRPGRGDQRRPRERERRHLARPVRQSSRRLSRVREHRAPRGSCRGPEARGLPPPRGQAVPPGPRCVHRQQGRQRHELREGDGAGRDLSAGGLHATSRRVLHGRQARRPGHARLRRAPRGTATVRRPNPVCLPARRHGARSQPARRAAIRARGPVRADEQHVRMPGRPDLPLGQRGVREPGRRGERGGRRARAGDLLVHRGAEPDAQADPEAHAHPDAGRRARPRRRRPGDGEQRLHRPDVDRARGPGDEAGRHLPGPLQGRRRRRLPADAGAVREPARGGRRPGRQRDQLRVRGRRRQRGRRRALDARRTPP